MSDEQTSEEVTHNTSKRNWFHRTRQKFRDTPDNFRLAGIGAWRGRERGLAVVAGVFLQVWSSQLCFHMVSVSLTNLLCRIA